MGGLAIEARELWRRFGAHVALAGVSLRVEPGETFALLGANGAGKTTFIRLVTGYLIPSAGSILVDGVSPAANRPLVCAKLGFVAETSRLYPGLAVRGFLRFAAGARGLAGSAARAAVDRTIVRFGLETVTHRVIGNLSKGFQQRVSLAQAFVHDPPLLVVDEPTGGLDPLQQEEVRGVLRELAGERTVLLCTHDLAEARALADRVAVLHQGRVVGAGPTAAVLGAGDPLALFRGEASSA